MCVFTLTSKSVVQANIQPFKKPISQFNIQLFPHPMFPGLSSAPLHCFKLLLCKHFIEVKLKVSSNWKSCTRTLTPCFRLFSSSLQGTATLFLHTPVFESSGLGGGMTRGQQCLVLSANTDPGPTRN